MIPFPEEKLQSLLQQIDHALEDGAEPIAAFDADGTLWESDMGEDFFQYQIDNQLVSLPDDPWDHYNYLKRERSPQEAYLWLAQINAGTPLKEVKGWAAQCLEKISPVSTFSAQKKIIDHLMDRNVSVFVVTASIKWAVEPAAGLYNIPESNVIGITTAITDGVVSTKQEGIITYREGKVTALLEHTGGKKPFFSAGNSPGDLHLLEAATHIAYVNASAPRGEELYDDEQGMIQLARERGWEYHSYAE